MAGRGNTVDWTLRFNVDKSGLNQLLQEFAQIEKQIDHAQQFSRIKMPYRDHSTSENIQKDLEEMAVRKKVLETELNTLRNQAKTVEKALASSFNNALGTMNMSKFNEQLKEGNVNLTRFYYNLAS